jgi:hypothetical protein
MPPVTAITFVPTYTMLVTEVSRLEMDTPAAFPNSMFVSGSVPIQSLLLEERTALRIPSKSAKENQL